VRAGHDHPADNELADADWHDFDSDYDDLAVGQPSGLA
jgi:hypothetical protein